MSEAIACPRCKGTGVVEEHQASISFTSADPATAMVTCRSCSGKSVGRAAEWEELRSYYSEPIASGNEVFELATSCARALNKETSTVLVRRSYEYMEDGREGASYYQRGSKRETAYCLHPDGSLGTYERSLPSQNRWSSPDAWSDWKPLALRDFSDFLIEFDFAANWSKCSDGWCDDDGWREVGDDVGTLARSSSISAFTMKMNTTSHHTITRLFLKGDGLVSALHRLTA